LHDFHGTLMAAGWRGKFVVSDEMTPEPFYLCDMSKDGQQVQLQLGGNVPNSFVSLPAVLVPVSGGAKYLQYTAADFEELQAVLGG
jgi:hypothetical protein